MSVDAAGPGVLPVASGDEVSRLVAVRGFLRSHRERRTTREVLGGVAYQIYVVVVFGGFWGYVVARSLHLAPDGSPVALDGGALAWTPSVVVALAALLTLAGARLGTWAGPLLVSRPDVSWLLPAPLSRRRLLRPHLLVGFGAAAVIGGLVGIVVGAVLALTGASGPLGLVVGSALTWSSLGVLIGALSLRVESSHLLARRMVRLTLVWIALLAAHALLVRVWTPAVWLAPWGWAGAPAIAAVAGGLPGWWLSLIVLPVAAMTAARDAYLRLDVVPDEELVRRAGVASGVRASAALFDARTIAQIRRVGQRWLTGVRPVRLPRPRRRWMVIPWRDLLGMLRRRGLITRTVVLAGLAVAVLVAGGAGPAAVVGASVIAYLAASDLLESFRVELEEPVAAELLPYDPMRLALAHTVMPMLALAMAGVVAVLGAAAFGAISWGSAPVWLLVAVLVCGPLTAVAAAAATRGSPPLHFLITGEQGVLILVAWFLAGPLVTLVFTIPPVLAASGQVRAGDSLLEIVPAYAAYAIAVTVGVLGFARTRVAKLV